LAQAFWLKIVKLSVGPLTKNKTVVVLK